MKEQFRNWRPRATLSIKYIDAEGNKGIWTTSQADLLDHITAIADLFDSKGFKLTNRQLYYQLVARDLIPNADAIYKRISKFITDARYGGYVDWDIIEDRSRVPVRKSQWDSIQDLIRSACAQYRLPRWKDQEFYVELYCEKQAMDSILKPITEKYHMYFGYNKGYSSASTIYDLSKRMAEQIEIGKKCVSLYLGDHDPSGLDMVRDVRERVIEFLSCGDNPVNYNAFKVVPIALNMSQIEKYGPPPNPAKIKDPRAKWYIEQYGNSSWELDALGPDTLQQIAEDGILQFLDMNKYNKWMEQEIDEKQALEDFGESMEDSP